MHNFKKIFSTFATIIFAFSLMVSAFAESGMVSQNIMTNSETSNSFEMCQIPAPNEDGIMPSMTTTGTGGTVTLDYMSDGRYVHWSVSPNTSLYYTFSGEISIYTTSTNSLRKTFYFVESGTETIDGNVDMMELSLRRGTKYNAVFTGTATDIAGNVFVVNPNTLITFTYY